MDPAVTTNAHKRWSHYSACIQYLPPAVAVARVVIAVRVVLRHRVRARSRGVVVGQVEAGGGEQQGEGGQGDPARGLGGVQGEAGEAELPRLAGPGLAAGQHQHQHQEAAAGRRGSHTSSATSGEADTELGSSSAVDTARKCSVFSSVTAFNIQHNTLTPTPDTSSRHKQSVSRAGRELYLPADSGGRVKVAVRIVVVKAGVVHRVAAVVTLGRPVLGEVIEVEKHDEEQHGAAHQRQAAGQRGGVKVGVEEPLRAELDGAHGHVLGQVRGGERGAGPGRGQQQQQGEHVWAGVRLSSSGGGGAGTGR